MNNYYVELNEVKLNKGLIIVHVNIRSLLHKFDLVKMDFLDNVFDFVGVGGGGNLDETESS